VARDELEDCIQQVRDRVEHIVSEGLASTVAPLQQQIKADSQHTSQMCVRMDALDAQQKVGPRLLCFFQPRPTEAANRLILESFNWCS
jgi:hypothetical protein